MTTQTDLQIETQMFTTLMALDMTDRDRSVRGGWNSETRLDVLAGEVVRYMPELAQMLAQQGMLKLAA